MFIFILILYFGFLLLLLFFVLFFVLPEHMDIFGRVGTLLFFVFLSLYPPPPYFWGDGHFQKAT